MSVPCESFTTCSEVERNSDDDVVYLHAIYHRLFSSTPAPVLTNTEKATGLRRLPLVPYLQNGAALIQCMVSPCTARWYGPEAWQKSVEHCLALHLEAIV